MSRRTVLVADDDADVRDVLTRLLEDEGYGVGTARDGVEAFVVAAADPPDLIVLDLAMPAFDGWGFIEAWRGQPAEHAAPILVLSTVGRAADATELGVQGCLAKPFDLDALLGAVARLRRSP